MADVRVYICMNVCIDMCGFSHSGLLSGATVLLKADTEDAAEEWRERIRYAAITI